MNDRTEPLTIGSLARSSGVPVRTIRFWSDIGLIPPASRSVGNYRLFDAEAVARVQLVRTLRELGLDLETVRRVLDRQVTLADVARTHASALDAEIRALRVRRAVLRSVAERGCTTEEMRVMHELVRLSAEERQRIIDDFVDEVFAGVGPEAPGAGIAAAMRGLPAELPDDPTPEQVDAWIELAGLVADPDFRERARTMAVTAAAGASSAGGAPGAAEDGPYDPRAVLEHARGAVAAGVAPESAEGAAVLHRIIDPGMPAGERARLADRVETFTDRRVERYWELLGVLNGRPPFPPTVPVFEWFIAALRAHG